MGFDEGIVDRPNTDKKWFNDDNDEQEPTGGIGRGRMHGSIINHLRDSPLKQTIQQRIVMKQQTYGYDGTYDDMIKEEDDETDGESIKLRRSSSNAHCLNNTAKSLRMTGKSTQ